MTNHKHHFDEYGQCFECDAIATASQLAKAKGLTGLKQIIELHGYKPNGQPVLSGQTLDNWYKRKPEIFETVLVGCVARLGINIS